LTDGTIDPAEGDDDASGGRARSCGYTYGGFPDVLGRIGTRKPCWLFARKFTTRSGAHIARFSSTLLGY
jgi:hypothetical protein